MGVRAGQSQENSKRVQWPAPKIGHDLFELIGPRAAVRWDQASTLPFTSITIDFQASSAASVSSDRCLGRRCSIMQRERACLSRVSRSRHFLQPARARPNIAGGVVGSATTPPEHGVVIPATPTGVVVGITLNAIPRAALQAAAASTRATVRGWCSPSFVTRPGYVFSGSPAWTRRDLRRLSPAI